jgi:hypothetical protein
VQNPPNGVEVYVDALSFEFTAPGERSPLTVFDDLQCYGSGVSTFLFTCRSVSELSKFEVTARSGSSVGTLRQRLSYAPVFVRADLNPINQDSNNQLQIGPGQDVTIAVKNRVAHVRRQVVIAGIGLN